MIDPACGTAGFLVAAAEYIRNHYEDTMTQEQWDAYSGQMFTGFDTDRTMLRIQVFPKKNLKRSLTAATEDRWSFTGMSAQDYLKHLLKRSPGTFT